MTKKKTVPWESEDLLALLRRRIEEGWTLSKIEAMSTDEILSRLDRLGLPITSERFRRDAARHDSAERMADGWCAQHTLRPTDRYDEDFVWMAAIVLWPRLVPERTCFEQIDERMQTGYRLLETDRIAEACDAWWQAWVWIEDKVTPERNTIEALDADFPGMQSVFNWCQDFEMELGNAGEDDPAYHGMRVRYCREFLATFAGVEWSMRSQFMCAEAESLWRLGDGDAAEARFEALVEEHPGWGWSYINWSDLYWLFEDSPKDYARAEAILKRAGTAGSAGPGRCGRSHAPSGSRRKGR